MKKISILLLGLAALYSCSNDPTASFETNVSNYAAESSHSVSYEDALATAISFMADESISTRTVSSFKVKNHYEYHANKGTRSAGEDSIDVRFHVINFSDDGGFALVSADDRTTPVYAYSSDGNLDLEDAIANTGFGSFMSRAATFYEQEIESSGIILGRFDPSPEYIQKVTSAPVEYYNGVPYYVITTYTFNSSKSALISANWNQCDPYNYYNSYTPNIGTNYCNKWPAGCGPVAIGQVCSYYQFPTVTDYNGSTVHFNWSNINSQSSYAVGDHSGTALNMAYLLKIIGVNAYSEYTTNNGTAITLTTMDGVDSALTSFNYISSGKTICTTSSQMQSDLFTSLNSNRPVILLGDNDYDSSDVHIFVVDGYTRYRQHKDYYDMSYPYPKMFSTTPNVYKNYFHCNWGWGGLYNAYVLDFQAAYNIKYNTNLEYIFNIHPNN